MGTSFFQAWTPYDDWHRYESLRVGVAARQEWVRGDIARAQDVLAAVRSVEESMGSAAPPSEPSPDPGS